MVKAGTLQQGDHFRATGMDEPAKAHAIITEETPGISDHTRRMVAGSVMITFNGRNKVILNKSLKVEKHNPPKDE